MSDTPPCAPTIYHPTESYVTPADLDCACDDLDLTIPVDADLEADPPVEAVPAGEHYELWMTKALHGSRRVYIATGGRFPGCITESWTPDCWDPRPCCGLPLGDPCRCNKNDRIRLPRGPVRDVLSVTIGEDDFEGWSLYGDVLERTDGEKWPSDGTLTIVYRRGLDLPPEGKALVAQYACELVKGCLPGGKCQIRSGYREIRVNGALYVAPDPMDYRDKLLTGFDPLDDWIVAILGGKARTRPRLAGRRRKRPDPLRPSGRSTIL